MEYLRPFQSHRDAVEKDKDQDHVVEELVGDDGLAEQPEPGDEAKRAKRLAEMVESGKRGAEGRWMRGVQVPAASCGAAGVSGAGRTLFLLL